MDNVALNLDGPVTRPTQFVEMLLRDLKYLVTHGGPAAVDNGYSFKLLRVCQGMAL